LQRQATQQVQQTAADTTAVARTNVVVAKGDIPARTPLADDMFEVRQLPQEAGAHGAHTPDLCLRRYWASRIHAQGHFVCSLDFS
jgi:Flp pilus assembly protein CpaB